MLPHFSLSPSWERSSLFSPRLVRKQRTRRSETTALNTAPLSPWQPALAHPRRAPHGFALHLTQKAHPDVWLPLGQTFGCGQDRIGRGENGARSDVGRARTNARKTHPAVLYRHLSEMQQTSFQETRGRAVIKVT